MFSYQAIVSSLPPGRREHIRVGVAVHVRREDGPGTVRRGRDHVLRERRRAPPVVLVPGDRVSYE